jgi:hypothetical protein
VLPPVLQQNQLMVSRFDVWTNGTELWFSRVFDNRIPTADYFRTELDGYLSEMKESKPLWDAVEAASKTTAAPAVPATPTVPVVPQVKPAIPESKPAGQPEVKPAAANLFTSKEGKFRARLDGNPTVTKVDSSIAKVYMPLTAYSQANEVEKTGYVVTYGDLPEALARLTPAQLFATLRDEYVAESKAKPMGEKDIKVGGFPGRDTTYVTADGNAVVTTRIVVADQRIYMLMVIRPQGQPNAADTQEFLDSFQVTR